MEKIGKMVLNRGKWQNKQIVSANWIKKSLTTYSNLADDKGYGYGWWTNDKVGYYEAAGRGRQTISVIPSKNMVVTFLGGEFDAGAIGSYIFRSIRSDKPIPGNKIAFSRLQTNARMIAAKPPFQPTPTNKVLLQQLDKKTIVLEKNISAIDSIVFHFSSKTVNFYRNRTKEAYPFLWSDNTYGVGFDPALQLPVFLQAWFEKDNELVLHYNQLSRINNFYFHFTIKGTQLSTTMEETSNMIKTTIPSSVR
jgi:hypothetical protein